MLGHLLEERGLKPGVLAAVLANNRAPEILVPCPPDSVPFKSAPAGDEAGSTDRRELCLAVTGLAGKRTISKDQPKGLAQFFRLPEEPFL